MPARCSADKIRTLMTARLLTASQLADAAGVSHSTIARILNGNEHRTSDSTLNLLAQALGCSPFDLLPDEAVNDIVRTETESAVVGVVAEAVAEALTVVVDGLDTAASQPTPQDIAKAVPAMEVTAPPVLDIQAYINYIRQTCDEKVALARDELSAVRRSRTRWIIFAISVIVFVLVTIIILATFVVWEILHPESGITALLWRIYNGSSIPGVTP